MQTPPRDKNGKFKKAKQKKSVAKSIAQFGIRDLVREEIRGFLGLHGIPVAKPSSFVDGATLLLSDIHIPLYHVRAFNNVVRFCKENAGFFQRLVLAGDVFDGTQLSRFPKSKRGEGHKLDFGGEVADGRELITDIVDTIKGDCYILEGNHEARLVKLLAKPENKGIPAEPLSLEALLEYYEYPARLEVIKGRVLNIGVGEEGTVKIIHGEKYNKQRASGLLEENLFVNTIQGHTHRPQTYWMKGRFGHVNGYLHDPKRQNYDPDPIWTMGFTILEHWDNGTKVNPYFVRIAEDGSFSWAGKVYK